MDQKYWTNSKINEFISDHKSIKKFQLETFDAKTFESNKGQVIYIPVQISW